MIEIYIDKGLVTEQHLKFRAEKIYFNGSELVLEGKGSFKDRLFNRKHVVLKRLFIWAVTDTEGRKRLLISLDRPKISGIFFEGWIIRGFAPTPEEFVEERFGEGVKVKIGKKLKEIIAKYLLLELV